MCFSSFASTKSCSLAKNGRHCTLEFMVCPALVAARVQWKSEGPRLPRTRIETERGQAGIANPCARDPCCENSRLRPQTARKSRCCGFAYVRVLPELEKAMFSFWTPGSSFADMRYHRGRLNSEQRGPRWSAGHAPESTFVGRAKRAFAVPLCDRHVYGVHSDGFLIGREIFSRNGPALAVWRPYNQKLLTR